MATFAPLQAVLGGLFIGSACGAYMLFAGRIAALDSSGRSRFASFFLASRSGSFHRVIRSLNDACAETETLMPC